MSITFKENVTLIKQVCHSCGVCYAIPERLDTDRRENGGSFYCPNGHGEVYRESDVKALEIKLARERQTHDQTSAELRDTKKSLIAQKGQTTKLKNRVSNGVCPCCNRSFVNLQRHMKTKHPKEVKSGKGNYKKILGK